MIIPTQVILKKSHNHPDESLKIKTKRRKPSVDITKGDKQMKIRCIMNIFELVDKANQAAEIVDSEERYVVNFDGRKDFTDYNEFKKWLKEEYYTAKQIIEYPLTDIEKCGSSWTLVVPFNGEFRTYQVILYKV